MTGDEYFYYVCLIVLCGLPMIVLKLYNEDTQKLERFYFENDRQKYDILKISVFILYISLILNGRFIMTEIFKHFYTKLGFT
jgi:uncharacterized membrane protein|uniref:Uncharacterized protein n=1 Tax=viral metagenome TaxID=1070528 RepID=A0A6C0BH01_9ZZZZ